MANAVKLEGLENVIKNLNKEIKEIKGATVEGLLAFGKIVIRDSDQRVPVEHGFLKASSYVRKAQNDKFAVDIGYSSIYALFVHENIEEILKGQQRQSGIGVYWGPHGESQFLMKALRQKQSDGLKEIKKRAKVDK